ncbi:MAG TPA: hypothetical protein VGO26_04385 [Amnibacterium sp.]|jgi:hypothetical protein|nr:hypothetical protein [Amnibacterium sp.]
MVLVIVLTVLTAWVLAAIALAFLTGGMIHERELHDRPLGAYSGRSSRRHAFN